MVNVGILEQSFATGTKITPQLLETKGIVKNISDGVKILGDGTIAKTFIIKGCEVSKSAKEKIEKVGGKVE